MNERGRSMVGQTRTSGAGRAPAWGANVPLDSEQAYDRLLDAAEANYAERGVSGTRMGDIADLAGVHRRTLYAYFPSKNALVAASFVRAVTSVLEAAEPCWHTEQPFLDQLVAAVVIGLRAARESPTLRVLLDDDEFNRTVRAAEASEFWRDKLADSLGRRIDEAIQHGEMRDDLTSSSIAQWVTRVAFSLIAEPGRPEDGGDEGLLRAYLAPALSPAAPEG